MEFIGLWVLLVIVSVSILLVSLLMDFGKISSRKKHNQKILEYNAKLQELSNMYKINLKDFKYSNKFCEKIELVFEFNDKEYYCLVNKREIFINNKFIRCKYVEESFDKLVDTILLILTNKPVYNYKKEIVEL